MGKNINCGCSPNLSNIPKGTTVIINPQSPAEFILKVFLCLGSFILITLFCLNVLGLSPLLSAIFGIIVSLCFGGCFALLVNKIDSLFKFH